MLSALAPGSCQTSTTKRSIILATLSDRDIQEGSRGREEKLKLKERERRVQELEGRFDLTFIVLMTIFSDNNIILVVVIIAIIIMIIIQVERRPAHGQNQRCGTQPAGLQWRCPADDKYWYLLCHLKMLYFAFIFWQAWYYGKIWLSIKGGVAPAENCRAGSRKNRSSRSRWEVVIFVKIAVKL